MEKLALSDFEPRLGSVFTMDVADGPDVDLALVSAERITTGSSPAGSGGRPFSLLFRGPAGHPFEQGIHNLTHPEMGSMGIFLVPMQPDDKGPLYEAVFS